MKNLNFGVRLGGTLDGKAPNLARLRNVKRAGVFVALALLLLISAACNDSQLRQASVVIRDFAVSLEQVQIAVETAHAHGFISDADHRAFEKAFDQIAAYGQKAVTAIRVAKSKPKALEAIDAALVETDKLLKEGLLGVKNENSRAAVSALILAMRGVLLTAKALLT